MQGADFSNSNITSVKFQGADLRFAKFSSCDVATSHYRYADLRHIIDFDWAHATLIQDIKIDTNLYNQLPEEIRSVFSMNVISDDQADSELSNLFRVKGTICVDGTEDGTVVRATPGGNIIGHLFEGTKVVCNEDQIEKHKGVWYRFAVPLSESNQDFPPKARENRTPGWVMGVYLQRITINNK